MSNAEVGILISAVCLLGFLPTSVFLVYNTVQTQEERSTEEKRERWLAIAGAFCSIEGLVYLIVSISPEADVLSVTFPLWGLPPWGWTLLVQGVLFGLASGAVAWYRNRSRGAWFVAGLLFGPFGLVASAAVGDSETTEPSRQESRGGGLCPNCGAHVQWGTGMCSECGHAFDGGEAEDESDGIPVYSSEGKVGEVTGLGRVLVLLLLTALAAGILWGYYHLAQMGGDVYLWCAFLGAALGIASLGGWYELFAGSVEWGCGTSFLLVMGTFTVLAVAPIWFHVTEAPRVSVQGTTARVERTVPPVFMEVDGILRLSGNGTLERTADALGRAVYEAAASGTEEPQSVVVSLQVPCSGTQTPDFAVHDTIRGASEVRAHAGAGAYVASEHWRSISRPQFVPDAPCQGMPFGLVEGFVNRVLALIQVVWRGLGTFWWALRTGQWGIVAVGVGILMWIYWKVRKKQRRAGTEDG